MTVSFDEDRPAGAGNHDTPPPATDGLARSAYAAYAREAWRAELALRGRPHGPAGHPALDIETCCIFLRRVAQQERHPLLARRAIATLRAIHPLALPAALHTPPRGVPG